MDSIISEIFNKNYGHPDYPIKKEPTESWPDFFNKIGGTNNRQTYTKNIKRKMYDIYYKNLLR